jgi:4-hydroxybenzoyl-CoA thioesterase
MQVILETMVQWGDCDEQGIVFYPRYIYWMDCAFHGLLRNIGLNQRKLRTKFGVLGTPLVKATATFASPASYDQRLAVAAEVARWGSSSFEVAYRGLSEGRTIFEGNETRVWLVQGPDKPQGAPIPEEFRSALAGAARDAQGLQGDV